MQAVYEYERSSSTALYFARFFPKLFLTFIELPLPRWRAGVSWVSSFVRASREAAPYITKNKKRGRLQLHSK